MLVLSGCGLTGPTGPDPSLVVASGAPSIETTGVPEMRSYVVRIFRTPEPDAYEARLRRARIDDSFAQVPPDVVRAEMTKAVLRVAASLCPSPELLGERPLGRPLIGSRRNDLPDEQVFLLRCAPSETAPREEP